MNPTSGRPSFASGLSGSLTGGSSIASPILGLGSGISRFTPTTIVPSAPVIPNQTIDSGVSPFRRNFEQQSPEPLYTRFGSTPYNPAINEILSAALMYERPNLNDSRYSNVQNALAEMASINANSNAQPAISEDLYNNILENYYNQVGRMEVGLGRTIDTPQAYHDAYQEFWTGRDKDAPDIFTPLFNDGGLVNSRSMDMNQDTKREMSSEDRDLAAMAMVALDESSDLSEEERQVILSSAEARLGADFIRMLMQSMATSGEVGDGMSDSVNARLSHGEYVIPADAVAHAGDGSTEVGAKRLSDLVADLREFKTGTTQQAPALEMGNGGLADAMYAKDGGLVGRAKRLANMEDVPMYAPHLQYLGSAVQGNNFKDGGLAQARESFEMPPPPSYMNPFNQQMVKEEDRYVDYTLPVDAPEELRRIMLMQIINNFIENRDIPSVFKTEKRDKRVYNF
jgi:hypothetical protein